MWWETVEFFLAVLGALSSIAGLIIGIRYEYQRRVWKKKLTWDDALRTARTLLEQISGAGWKPDLVIGIGRSGGIWGGWLAGNLGSLPFVAIDDKYEDVEAGLSVDFPCGKSILSNVQEFYSEHGTLKVLVVEGASRSGGTPQKFREQFAEILRHWDVKLAVVYKNPGSAAAIDFVGMVGPEPWPEKFPWHETDAYRPYLRDVFPTRRAA